MKLFFSDNTELELPATLMVDRIKSEPNRTEERAPYSRVVVTAGDGLPVAQPMTVSGKVYFQDAREAHDWYLSLRDKLETLTRFQVDRWFFDIHAADLIAVPVLLPRVLNLTMRIFPKRVVPSYIEDSWFLQEYAVTAAAAEDARHVGFKIAPKYDLEITDFRMVFSSDMTNPSAGHRFKVWNANTETLVGKMGPFVPLATANTWKEFELPTPIKLYEGQEYLIGFMNVSGASSVGLATRSIATTTFNEELGTLIETYATNSTVGVLADDIYPVYTPSVTGNINLFTVFLR